MKSCSDTSLKGTSKWRAFHNKGLFCLTSSFISNEQHETQYHQWTPCRSAEKGGTFCCCSRGWVPGKKRKGRCPCTWARPLDMRYFHTSPCARRKTSYTFCASWFGLWSGGGTARVRILKGCRRLRAKNKRRRPSTQANWKLFFFRPIVGFQRATTTNNGARSNLI